MLTQRAAEGGGEDFDPFVAEGDDGEAVVVGGLCDDVADGRGGAEVDVVAGDADGGLGGSGSRGEQEGGCGDRTTMEHYIHKEGMIGEREAFVDTVRG